jgi:hypothetical protein
MRAPSPHRDTSAIIDHEPDHRFPFTAMYLESLPGADRNISDGFAAIHILWTSTPQPHAVLAGHDPAVPGDLIDYPVHPGDTIVVPPHAPFAIGEGCLAFILAQGNIDHAPDDATPALATPMPPTHGLGVFHRFNRRTICAARPGLLLERWKITEPLALDLDPGRWHYLTNLVDPATISWAGGAVTMRPTQSCLVPPLVGSITVVPDSLAYILVASEPNLEKDIVAPLQSAGYDKSAIAELLGTAPE